MGYLPQLLAVLIAHGVVEAGVRWDASSTHVWLALAFLPVPWLLGHACQATYTRGYFRLGGALHTTMRHSAPALHGLLLAFGGWDLWLGEVAGHPLSLYDWPTAWHALLALPWLAYELVTLETRTRLYIGSREQRAWRVHQARNLVATLAPLALYFALALLVGLVPELQVRIEEIGLYEGVFLVVYVALLAWCLPQLVAMAWDTRELAPGVRTQRIQALLQRSHLTGTRVREWRTGWQLTNAAVVGLTQQSRLVLLSDALLAQMDDDELEAVVAHELAHVRLRHVPFFLAYALGFVLLLDLWARHYEDQLWFAGGIMAGGLALWFVSFTWLSRRVELQADLHAMDLVGQRESMIRALEKVGGRLRDVAGWRHFSVRDRVAFLERCGREPQVRQRLERTLRSLAIAASAVFVVALALQATRLVRVAPTQHAWADLRLGAWSAAQARSVQDEPELSALIRRASELAPAEVDAESLALRARGAAQRGDEEAAGEWLALAALRAPYEWTQLARAYTQGDRDQARTELYERTQYDSPFLRK